MTALKAKVYFGKLPRYEVVDKFGRVRKPTFFSARAAGEWAHEMWPDQEQDEDRTGKGWDVQVVGCE